MVKLNPYSVQLLDLSLQQGRPILLCSQDDSELMKNAYKTIELPQIVDCLQGILSVIPLQLMSFHLAVLRGYDVSSRFSYAQERLTCIRHFVPDSNISTPVWKIQRSV